jgi:phage shock protein A
MGIFKRINDIVSANLNDMVESWEEPEKMLKQAIREMEVSIEDSKRSVAKAMASEKMLGKELLENHRQADEWQRRAEQAVESGNDDLARKALARKQEHEKVAAALVDQHTASQEAVVALRRQLEAMQAKLADAKRRLSTLVVRKKAADMRARVQMGTADATLNTDAFAKFDRLREKVEMAEAEAEALRELSDSSTSENGTSEIVADEDLEVDAELVKLKKKLGK